jgi:hypothetical protein
MGEYSTTERTRMAHYCRNLYCKSRPSGDLAKVSAKAKRLASLLINRDYTQNPVSKVNE